jgi:diguanylate cyclase (GGDEF)-like protein
MAQLNQANTAMEQQQLELKEANRQLALRQSELANANEMLSGLASTDSLTGLNNRRAFEEQISKEADRSCRYGSPLSLLMLDVDHFKQFNDSFGHLAGDAVLQEVGRILSTAARSTDFPARFGGEEFALVLPETNAEAALEVAERIRVAISESRIEGSGVTISIGLSSMAATSTAASLVAEADEALYAAKRGGRNQVVHFNRSAVELPGAAAVAGSSNGRKSSISSDRGSRITDPV